MWVCNRIGQGGAGIGERGAEYVEAMRLGIQLGMCLIDTAEIYGEGRSEELIGQAIEGMRRRVFLCTKFSGEHSAYEDVIKAAEGSLRRLKTDWIDLYYPHWPSLDVPIEETMRAMAKLVDDGKIRYIGLSNFSVKQMQEAQACLSHRLVAVQHEYNLCDRTAEQQIIPFCREHGLMFIAWTPLLRGNIAPNDERRNGLNAIAARYSMSSAQLALRWLLREPYARAIPKAGTKQHVRENVAAAECEIAPPDLEQISDLYQMKVVNIPTELIRFAKDSHRQDYHTLNEARGNCFGFVPSPARLAEHIASDGMLKPLKVRPVGGHFELIEGGVRYWAWIMAHGEGVPIPALSGNLQYDY